MRKGKIRGVATSGNYIAFGEYALQAQGHERITSRQIEAARQAMTRYIKRGGKIWIRIFPHTPVTRKPQDVKMGSGKGNPEFFVAKVRPGTIMFEMQGVTEEVAREAMRLAAHKLPVKTKFLVTGGGIIMKIAEIRKLSTAELTAESTKLREEIAELKRRLHMGEVQNVRVIRTKRKDLARMLTVLSEQLTKEAK